MRRSGRPNRLICLPKRYINEPPPLPPHVDPGTHPTITSTTETTQSHPITWLHTRPDRYRVYRAYMKKFPSLNPDNDLSLDLQCDSPNFSLPTNAAGNRLILPGFGASLDKLRGNEASLDELRSNIFAPFLNTSVYRMMHWYYSGSDQKSFNELDRLVHSVILSPDFDVNHLRGFRASREAGRLDKHTAGETSTLKLTDGWIKTTLELPLPCKNTRQASEQSAQKFEVENVYYRRLVPVITSALKQSDAEQFHVSPFKTYWKRTDDSSPERIYSEIYTADVYLEEQAKLDALPQLDGQTYENVIIGLTFWSDSTRSALRSGLVRFFCLFWHGPGPGPVQTFCHLGNNQTRPSRTGLQWSKYSP